MEIILLSLIVIGILWIIYLISKDYQSNKGQLNSEKASSESTKKSKTSIFAPQIYSYFNELCYPFLVESYGNQITIDFAFEKTHRRVFINMNPKSSIIIYRVLILKDFPDERLHKLTELIVRLNTEFLESKFNMLMENRFILFDVLFPTNDDIVDKALHKDTIAHLMAVFNKYYPCFTKVAFEGEEPISALLDLPEESL
jgi:hypothetical protein